MHRDSSSFRWVARVACHVPRGLRRKGQQADFRRQPDVPRLAELVDVLPYPTATLARNGRSPRARDLPCRRQRPRSISTTRLAFAERSGRCTCLMCICLASAELPSALECSEVMGYMRQHRGWGVEFRSWRHMSGWSGSQSVSIDSRYFIH